jgi:hypothetical protein
MSDFNYRIEGDDRLLDPRLIGPSFSAMARPRPWRGRWCDKPDGQSTRRTGRSVERHRAEHGRWQLRQR